MNHQQLRELVRDHFAKRVAGAEARIDAEGPLSAAMQRQCKEGIVQDASQLEHGFILPEVPEMVVSAFLKEHTLEFDRTDEKTEKLARLIMEGRKAYYEAALSYSDAAMTFDFSRSKERATPQSDGRADRLTLEQLVGVFWKFARIEGRWTDKTEKQNVEHIKLLYECLGNEIQATAIGRKQAQLMRDTLVSYPVNRNKNPATRGRPLIEILDIPGIDRLHTRTINKYLHTYNGMFNWAVQNGHCEINPFLGLAIREKQTDEAPRLPFSNSQIQTITRAVLDGSFGQKDHHKWGTLLAIHTGARLNEIAQLHLEDVREVDGIWCIDINRKPGTLKKLKNAASKRVVPLHPQLVGYGFLSYFHAMSAQRGNERLFPSLTYSSSEGYGRNLGRWVNESMLPGLNIKTDQLTFHSFRHTMVTRLSAANVEQAHIMAIVGHEPGTTTLKTYNRNGFPPALLLAALEQAAL